MLVPQSNAKPFTPEALASGMVQKHGAEKAAKILHTEARAFIGMEGHQSLNHNMPYFTCAYNWVVKRYPKAKIKTTEAQ